MYHNLTSVLLVVTQVQPLPQVALQYRSYIHNYVSTRAGIRYILGNHCVCLVASVMSNSMRPYGLSPTRLLCPCDSPGKNSGVGCHALLQGIFLTQESNLHLFHLLHQWACSLPLASPETSMTCYIFKFIDIFYLFMGQHYNKTTIHPQEPQKSTHKVPHILVPQRE